jgi:hypothetical protein
LSLHAATKLKAETELALRFRLESTEEPIEATGRVAWLDPSQKEAGISFENLSSDAERRIADWIAAQEQPASIGQGDTAPQPKSRSTRSAAPPLSIQTPAPANLATEEAENVQASVSERIPRRVVLESSVNDFAGATSGLQRTTSPPAALAFPTPDRFERPSDKLLRLPPNRYEALLEHKEPQAAKQILPRDSQSPSLTPAPARVAEVNRPAPRADDSAASKLRERRKLGLAGAAAAAGILALVVTVMIGSSRPMDHGGSGEESAQPISSAAAVEPASALPTATEAPADLSAQAEASEDAPAEAYYDLLPILSTHQPATVPQDDDWAANLEAILGVDVPAKINPAVLGLPVWTVQHSGFYYCADNLNSETPQPGVLMTQGDALQSGYRPKLGSYCN